MCQLRKIFKNPLNIAKVTRFLACFEVLPKMLNFSVNLLATSYAIFVTTLQDFWSFSTRTFLVVAVEEF